MCLKQHLYDFRAYCIQKEESQVSQATLGIPNVNSNISDVLAEPVAAVYEDEYDSSFNT